jgi:hypothetical protein
MFVLDVYCFSAYVAILQLEYALAEQCNHAMTKADGCFVLIERDLRRLNAHGYIHHVYFYNANAHGSKANYIASGGVPLDDSCSP